jgi:gluconate 5-dehydrogenase
MLNAFSLNGKLALVTGASRGIGLGAASALAQAGSDVILVARGEADLQRAEDSLRASGAKVSGMAFDLAATESISSWFDTLVERFGVPDLLVNNAGITRRGLATELTLADWQLTLSINLTAMFEISRCFARHCISQRKPAKIVNIASIMTAAARRGTAAYTASKGGVGQLTKALAIDWAEHHIHVNAIAPGYIETDLNSALLQDPEFNAWVKKRCPLGRWGKPDDIAWPIVFLLSPASDFITGQVIYVDGGWLATF